MHLHHDKFAMKKSYCKRNANAAMAIEDQDEVAFNLIICVNSCRIGFVTIGFNSTDLFIRFYHFVCIEKIAN
jgi:hypothetical protein